MRPRKLVLILLLTSFFLSPVSGFAEHSVDIEGENAYINSTLGFSSEEKINYWRIFWEIPKDAEILSIRDTIGEIENYTVNGRSLKITTNKGEKRRNDTLEIRMKVKDVVREKYSPLKTATLSFSGFKGDETKCSVEVDGLISGSFSRNFEASFQGDEMFLKGKGPFNLKIAFSEEGTRYEHFVMFQDYNVSLADKFYPYVVSVTGIKPPFDRFPVIVLPDSEYQDTVGNWSAGVYRRGGLIFIKKSEMESKTNTSMLIHEAAHGFNEQVMRWDFTNSSYFDEGVAKYLEYLVDKKLEIRQPEIFGESVLFEENGDRYKLPPRMKPEDLWDYYRLENDFMLDWNPRESNRNFGYAYSELMIRNYVLKNGYDSLHPVYKKLGKVSGTVRLPETKYKVIKNAMPGGLKPCYYGDKEKLEKCLEKVNNQTPEVPVLEESVENEDFFLNFTNLEDREFSEEKEKNKDEDPNDSIPSQPKEKDLSDEDSIARSARIIIEEITSIFKRLLEKLLS